LLFADEEEDDEDDEDDDDDDDDDEEDDEDGIEEEEEEEEEEEWESKLDDITFVSNNRPIINPKFLIACVDDWLNPAVMPPIWEQETVDLTSSRQERERLIKSLEAWRTISSISLQHNNGNKIPITPCDISFLQISLIIASQLLSSDIDDDDEDDDDNDEDEEDDDDDDDDDKDDNDDDDDDDDGDDNDDNDDGIKVR